jgi:NAD(P)-dependent dehydrogenase (short-subunit alcohol dehydrogenase family)
MSKVVVVTGAARGIGLATAKKFLSEGWRVALLDIDGKTQDLARNNLMARHKISREII